MSNLIPRTEIPIKKKAAKHLDVTFFLRRLGCFTASRADEYIDGRRAARTGKVRSNVAAKLLAEKMTDAPQGRESYFQPAPLEWGVEMEKYAEQCYRKILLENFPNLTLNAQESKSFPIIENTDCYVLATPDLVVLNPDNSINRLAEIKCLESPDFLEICSKDDIPIYYQKQMEFQCLVFGADQCDFIVFDPRQPAGKNIKIINYPVEEITKDFIRKSLINIYQAESEILKQNNDFFDQQGKLFGIDVIEQATQEVKEAILANSKYGCFITNRTQKEQDIAITKSVWSYYEDDREALIDKDTTE